MKTEELITNLTAEGAPAVVPIERSLVRAIALGCALSVAIFLVAMHPRPDIALAFQSPRFVLKLIVACSLALTSVLLLPDVARPLSRLPRLWSWRFLSRCCSAALSSSFT